jgi:hypothetical protein
LDVCAAVGVEISDIIGGLFGNALGASWRRRRDDRLRQRGGLKCFLRTVTGVEPGVTQKWHRGKALLASGEIRFKGATIRVLSSSRDQTRAPSFR